MGDGVSIEVVVEEEAVVASALSFDRSLPMDAVRGWTGACCMISVL